MYTLKNLVRGNVIDVIYSAKTNRLYLVLDPAYTPGDPHYLLPLLCPACGEPWHFVWSNTPEQLAAALKKSLTGFELVEAQYFPRSSAKNIAATMEKFSLGSAPADLLLEIAADHLGEDELFPIIALSFEQRVPSIFPSPADLRNKTPDEVRELLDLDEKDDVEEAILEIEDWMAEDDYEDFDVVDDILIAVHPKTILDAIVVDPVDYFEEDEPTVYPYQSILSAVENIEQVPIDDEDVR